MVRRSSIQTKWIGIYLLLVFSSTLVILGMIINMHNRDCNEQVILKTYALINSMTNGNQFDQQKLLSKLLQDDELLYKKIRNGIELRDLPDLVGSREQISRNALNRISSKLTSMEEQNDSGPGMLQFKPIVETVQLKDHIHRQPPKEQPKKEQPIKEQPKKEQPKKEQHKKKLDLSDGLRNFELDPHEGPPRDVKNYPPANVIKFNLQKSLNKHINQDHLTHIRENLVKSGLSFERTVTTLILNDTEEQTEERKRKLESKMHTPFESCAVIGNGGILDRSYCGPEIDAHDFVMRSNMAPIDGFEEDVGSKVDFMTLNGEGTKTLLKCIKKYNDSCRRIYNSMKTIDKSIIWFSKYGSLNQKFTSLIGKHFNSTITHPSEPLSEELMKFWDITEHPSSGLFLYSIAAPLCKTISLYGFYPYSKLPNGNPTRYHYYEKFFIDEFDMGHDLPKEFKLLMKLNRSGALRLRTKPCF
ncbi:uncharacterized protein [Antedon mediterranea]|uniref:uncharacterized protein n=1 Tax=Antedon mediterranea TaxID=105859 RepID=UPI003AF70587